MPHLFSLVFIFLLFVQASLVQGRPISNKKGDVTVLHTVHTAITDEGPVTETCEISLTPITDRNGREAVEEVRKCFLTFDDGGGTENGKSPGVTSVPSVHATATSVVSANPEKTTSSCSSSSTSIPPSRTSSTSSIRTPSVSSTANTHTSMSTSTSSNKNSLPTETFISSSQSTTSSFSASNPASAPTSSPAVSTSLTVVIQPPASATSTPSVVSSATPSSVTPSPASGSSAGSENDTTPTTTATSDSSNTTAQGSGTSAPDSTASATAAFQLPGKQLSVLPIGLGVFAGISVIALIVVGLVTYERTKYRRAFRQRKLAESGATMGYGGMAQRP